MSTDVKLGLVHRLYTGQISYDFIKHRKFWYLISAVLLTISLLALLVRGLSLGIEFRGGTDFQVSMPVTQTTVEQVRNKVSDFGVQDLQAQVFSIGDNAVRIQTRALTPEETSKVRIEIGKLAGSDEAKVSYSAIGASWGQQISQQAAIALVVFIALVMLLIWAWFRDWKMAVAAIVALAHDVLITVGIYALIGFTVTPATVIGVLTILGYSLYDTVVVFDKVKENVTGLSQSKQTYSQAANLAINQVLVRSLNTTVIGVLPVAALLIAGAGLNSGPLADLGLALFVGMLAGAYSSIFIATPILAWLKEKEPAQVEHRAALLRRAERHDAKEQRRSVLAQRATSGNENAELAAAEAEVADLPDQETGAPAVRTQRRVRTPRAERKRDAR